MDRPLDLAGKIEDSDRPRSAQRCFAVLNNAVITASGRPVFVVHPGLPVRLGTECAKTRGVVSDLGGCRRARRGVDIGLCESCRPPRWLLERALYEEHSTRDMAYHAGKLAPSVTAER
jgi:hypothetical protein